MYGASAAPLERGPKGLFIFSALRNRQLVTAVIMGIIRVALDPVETDGVALAQREKPLPQVRVEGRLLVPHFMSKTDLLNLLNLLQLGVGI